MVILYILYKTELFMDTHYLCLYLKQKNKINKNANLFMIFLWANRRFDSQSYHYQDWITLNKKINYKNTQNLKYFEIILFNL